MIKKILSIMVSAVTVVSFIPQVPVKADEIESYPYTLFAGSNEEGALTINSNTVCINGNIATNGTISTTAQYLNVNGMRKENAQEEVKLFFNKINERYFTSHVETYFEDYYLEDTNINVNIPIESTGDIELSGNINITSGIKALNDVNLGGNVENTQDSVICSKTGDITINTDNLNLNGLVYAPNGSVNITAQNLNLNSVIIIADTITITCPNLNANYNSQMAEFIGNESETVINEDDDNEGLKIDAYGFFDEEDDIFTVYWNTTVQEGTFDILISDDKENYTLLETVTDDNSYEYTFTEPFDKKYIKVKETTKSGKVCESVPFSVIFTEEGYDIEYVDSDEDGIPDFYETEIGTDVDKADTDEDGLTDYQEYIYTKTDPLVYDSVNERTSDADIDIDEDGLSNLDELTRGTSPINFDTDNDGLSDYDEIFVYNTDPLVADSDEDGITDGSEIKLGLDPNDPATNGVPDGEYVIPQSISADSDILSSVNTAESPYELSIDIKTNGDAEKELTVDESGYSAVIENDAMIGASIDVEIADACNPEEIVLKYKINDTYINNDPDVYSDNEKFEGIRRLAVFKYFNDVNAMFPLYTEYDLSSNTISVNVKDGGTYCVIDTEKWFYDLGIDLTSTNVNTSSQPLRLNAPKALAAENGVNASNSNQKIGKGAFGYIFDNVPVDLVFMIQNSGSNYEWQKENFEFEKQLIHDISAYAFKTYKDVHVHLIPYGFTTQPIDLHDGWIKYTENSIGEVDNALEKIEYQGYGQPAYRNLGYRFAADNLMKSYRPTAKSFVINLINGSTNFIKDKYNNDCEWVYSYFWYNEMVFSEVVYNGNKFDKYLSNYIKGNANDVTNVYMRQHILNNTGADLTLDTTSNSNYNDIIRNIQKHVIMTPLHGGYSPIDWKPIILKGELNSQNGIDTDGDCLTDWEETDVDKLIKHDDGSFDLPTVSDYIRKIKDVSYRESIVKFIEGKFSSAANSSVNGRAFAPTNNSATAEAVYNLKVYGTTSNPMKTDTDGDGYTDLDDPKKDCLPKYLEGRYDLFDGEIYSILKGETCFELNGGAIASNTAIVKAASCDGSEKQRFRFVWHDAKNGYTIHPIADEKKALTFITASHEVCLRSYTNTNILTNQLWEVIPSGSSVILRTKYLETNGYKTTPFYLAYDKTDKKLICVSNDKEKFTISNPTYNWKRFGEIYLDFISVPEKQYILDDHIAPAYEAILNYYNNVKIGIDVKNHKFSGINNYESLYDQNCFHGGNYNKLRFGLAKMSDVACEIMATYNALAVTGEYDCYQNGILTNDIDKFLRLATEFEINAKFIIVDGYFGSNPEKIGNCLKVYNRKYVVYNEDELNQLDTNIRHAKCAILSYNFGFLHLKIHTFFCYYDNSTNNYNWFNSGYKSELPGSMFAEASVKDFFEKSDRFKIGYVLL